MNLSPCRRVSPDRRRYAYIVVLIALALQIALASANNPFERLGFNLTDSDLTLMTEAMRPFFDDDNIPVGTVRSWSNPESHNSGTAMLDKRVNYKGLPCRPIQHDIKIHKMADPFHFVVDRCRVADGTWKLF